MHTWLRLKTWARVLRCFALLITAYLAAGSPLGGAPRAAAAGPGGEAGWREIHTPHFRIFQWRKSSYARVDDDALGATCERALARVSTYWFGSVEPLRAKCEIVLHPSAESYGREVGEHAAKTAGAVLIDTQGERPWYRVVLRADRWNWQTASLPHELTHVVFANHFAPHRLPSWINEGTALMADPPSKRAHHLSQLRAAIAGGATLRTDELMALVDYPAERCWPAFYGQSLSLVQCLVARKSPQAFVEFVDTLVNHDLDVALERVYDIRDLQAFAAMWAVHVTRPDSALARANGPFDQSDRHMAGDAQSSHESSAAPIIFDTALARHRLP